jgi:hypothetical protein
VHTNHRRKKNKRYVKKGGWPHRFSYRWYKVFAWQSWKSHERHLMVNERYEELPNRVIKTVLWDAF